MRLLIGTAAAALAALALPAVAQAAPHTTVYTQNGVLIVEAAEGKANAITITINTSTKRFIVGDTGDQIAVGSGCTLVSGQAQCLYEAPAPLNTRFINSISVRTGDLNDRVNVAFSGLLSDAVPAYVSGGDGNDVMASQTRGTLSGGVGNDTLRPKRGGVSVVGGTGTDTVDYRDGSPLHPGSGVSVTLGSGADDGYKNIAAKDNVFGDVENILGTDNVDHLVGNASVNNIQALGGDDFLWGKEALDTLNGGNGIDTCLDAVAGEPISCP